MPATDIVPRDPSTMTEPERLDELAALLAQGVLRLRDIARRCGDSTPAQTGEIPPADALNSPSMEAVIERAVNAAENGERPCR